LFSISRFAKKGDHSTAIFGQCIATSIYKLMLISNLS
jgi:hypothetical protein